MHSNNSSWGVMNDALVPTDPCRCMFKWMGLNLTIEMTGHSFLGHGAGYMNGLWRWGAWWLMPHEEEPGNLRRKTRENHPCRKCERLEDPWVVALFLNQATSYPLYHLIPVWRSLHLSSSNQKWSYLSHADVSIISGQQCCWMRHLR